MYTSADVFRKHWKIFLGVSLFTGMFAAIYEHFSHQVYSWPMMLAFLVPLLLGVTPTAILSTRKMLRRKPYEGKLRAGVNLYYAGVATLTVGMVATGVVEIYGTTNRLLATYWYVAGVLLVAGIAVTIAALVERRREIEEKKAARRAAKKTERRKKPE